MLAVLFTKHRGPLAYDLRHYHGLSLAALPSSGIPLTEVAALVAYLPPESACRQALSPHSQHTHELELLRSIDYTMRWLAWTKTTDAKYGKNIPEPYRFPWEPEPERPGWHGDSMTVEEADAFLGWTNLKGA